MSLSIRTNISSLNAQRNLSATQLHLDGSLSRLSSGFRITKAGDDAAGLGISTKLESQIRSYNQAVRNANDGISVVQSTEAALNEQANILTRMRELAMQSASDGVGSVERGYIDQESTKLLAELQRISQVAEYNGTKLLDGSAATLDFQVGIAATGDDVISLTTLNGTTAAAGVAGAPTPAGVAATGFAPPPGLAASATAFNDNMLLGGESTNASQLVAEAALLTGGMSIAAATYVSWATTYIFDTAYRSAGGLPGLESIAGAPNAAQQAGLDLVTATQGGGAGSGTGSALLASAFQTFAAELVAGGGNLNVAFSQTVAALGATSEADSAASAALYLFAAGYEAVAGGGAVPPGVTLGAAATAAGLAALGQAYSAPGAAAPASTGGLGVAGLSLSSKASALASLASIDAALETISSNRATLGAAGNRFQSAIANIQAFSESLSAANSRIKDVDVAEETSRMSRSQILMQAGVSVLAQANQLPQMALKLLG